MAKAYAELIMKGVKTLDDVPGRILEDVKKILDAAGWKQPEENAEQNN